MTPTTPVALQDVLNQLAESEGAKQRAWRVLRRIRNALERWHGDKLPDAGARSLEDEGVVLLVLMDHLFTEREMARRELCAATRRFLRTASESEGLPDRPEAHQAVLRALENADRFVGG